MTSVEPGASLTVGEDPAEPPLSPGEIIIATILRVEGITGVHTHFRQLGGYLAAHGVPARVLTPFSWAQPLTAPVFGARFLWERCSGSANVWWYRHWHEAFLHQALKRQLGAAGDCVVYAQCPLSARAALRARRSPRQRVVMAVHFRTSQADEWADKDRGAIPRDGRVFHSIRALERAVLPQVDGLVFVSAWGRDALLDWCPEAAAVPSVVISNFVAPVSVSEHPEPVADLVSVGNLETVKNHRYLIEVLYQAKRLGRVLTIDIFGEGPTRRDLEQLVAARGLEGQVRLHGFCPDVRDRLSGYRACVHASSSESLPLAIIEAMSAGLPVLAGDTGGVAELFGDGVEGYLWPLDEPARAATMLVELLDDEQRRAAVGAAARARFERELDADVVAPRLLAFLAGGGASAATATAPGAPVARQWR